MAVDPSLRARLREALQQSAVGRPRAAAPTGGGIPHPHAGGDLRADEPRELEYEREDNRRAQAEAAQARWIAETLGGWWQRDGAGACLVVDRLFPGDRLHGHCEIAVHAEAVRRYQQTLYRLDRRESPRVEDKTLFARLDTAAQPPEDQAEPALRLLFFDLETTGLSGGAGTCAFLIGYGWFEGDGFRTRQYFLGGYGHEQALLRMAVAPLSDGSGHPQTLVSFNGKTFDVPLIQGRYLFHRLPSPFDGVPHVDLLPPARSLWRYRASGEGEDRLARSPSGGTDPGRNEAFARYFRASALRQQYNELWNPMSGGVRAHPPKGGSYDRAEQGVVAASCALGVLEDDILGFRRFGDVPGAEIPARYFHYARSGDVRPLQSVLEHNRFDLVSLAALASVIARIVEEGPRAARTVHECLALGRFYERTGADDRAAACYRRLVDGEDSGSWPVAPGVEREALRRLALGHRRRRRHDQAAQAWQRLLDLIDDAESGDHLMFEALHGLAIHHEHRSRDLDAARALVVRAIGAARDPVVQEDLRYRLARIERKMSIRRGDAT